MFVNQPYDRHGTFNDDALPTKTSVDQEEVESDIAHCFDLHNLDKEGNGYDETRILCRERHIAMLKHKLLDGLDRYESLDSSRPWLAYWITHSLALLGAGDFLRDNSAKVVDFLERCISPDEGGYAGGPTGQEAHLAITYAAVNAIVSLGCERALGSINRSAVRRFLLAMQQNDGSFRLHKNGEVDIRGAYCALSVAKLLKLKIFSDPDCEDDLFANTADWLLSCQTYEGGFGATPGNEAHGGYTFCGVAGLKLLGHMEKCDLNALLRWTVNKQQKIGGGFAGRTNKLVDACYSFWVGAVPCNIYSHFYPPGEPQPSNWLFNHDSLQEYLYICSQNKFGGFRDKPKQNCDLYHTCYALAGLSLAQHRPSQDPHLCSTENLLQPIDPLHNVCKGPRIKAYNFFE